MSWRSHRPKLASTSSSSSIVSSASTSEERRQTLFVTSARLRKRSNTTGEAPVIQHVDASRHSQEIIFNPLSPIPPSPAPPATPAFRMPSRPPSRGVAAQPSPPPPVPSLPSNLNAMDTRGSPLDNLAHSLLLDQFPLPPERPPSTTSGSLQAPQFRPVLVTPCPHPAPGPSQIIVTLETSTSSLRTTLATLTSRPSHLSTYLTGLFPEENLTAPPSPTSPHFAAYQARLSSGGEFRGTSATMHIFLDRPSACYPHIMSYLRGTTPTLPRATLRQGQSTSDGEEFLFELRDEAIYLGLEELATLCMAEVAHRDDIPLPEKAPSLRPSITKSYIDGFGQGACSTPDLTHSISSSSSRSGTSESSRASVFSGSEGRASPFGQALSSRTVRRRSSARTLVDIPVNSRRLSRRALLMEIPVYQPSRI